MPYLVAAQAGVPASADSLPVRNVGVVRPGDALKLTVYRDRDFNGEYLIDSRGSVQIAGLGVIQVAGLGPAEVRERLREQLVRRGTAEPEFAVQILVRVSVLGEVRQPGLQTVDPGTTLIQLVSIAGGAADRADLTRTQVIREGRVYTVDLQSAIARGSAAGQIVLYSNDVVNIPKRSGLTRDNASFALSALTAILSIATFIVARR